MTDDEDRADGDAEPTDAGPTQVLKTEQMFGDRRELWIEHNGERYRLRITRRGKLILQK